MAPNSQIDAFKQRSILDRIIMRLYALISKVFVSTIVKLSFLAVFAIIMFFAVIWFPSHPLRDALDSWLWSTALALLSFVLLFLWGRLNTQIQSLLAGPPLFGKLGGIPARFYVTALRARQHVEFELTEEDQQWLNSFEELDKTVLEDSARDEYMASVAGGDLTDDEKDNEWKHIWKDEILALKVDNITFEDFMYSGTLGSKIVVPALFRSVLFTTLSAGIFTILMLFTLAFYLSGSISLHSLIQLGVSLSLVLAALWHFVFMHTFVEWHVDLKQLVSAPSPENAEAYEDEIKALGERTIRPTSAKIDKGFVQTILGHTYIHRMCDAFASGLISVGLIWIYFGLHYLVDPASSQANFDWYWVYTLGVIGIGILFTAGFYIMLFILENLRYIMAAVISGMVCIVLPFLLQILLGQDVEISTMTTVITAGLGGLVATVSTVISSRFRNSLGSR